MRRKQKFGSLYDLQDYFRTEKQCINYFIKQRWNGKSLIIIKL